MAKRAAVYARISQDRAGDELGVDRQRADCMKLAEGRGWAVVDVLVDDDRSAYTGKPRPGYERLLDLIKSGGADAVVAWHPDRLHRSPRELETFIDVVEASGAVVATVQAGDVDLATASGRMTARVVGAVARHESEQKSERIRRQREQMALTGKPQGGGRRAFGYDPSGSTLIKAEAKLIREAVDRLLAGESLRAIAFDWNARSMRSASGGTWSVTSLRTMVAGPRIAGLRVHHGEVVGAGTWPAIITRAEHDAIRARLGNPREHRVGRPPTSMLGGIIACGRCGQTMHASTYPNGARRYMCAKAPGRESCGGVAIIAEPTEQIVVEVVLRRLDTPALARAMAKPRDAKVEVDVVALEDRMAQLAEMFADGEIGRAEWLRARSKIEKQLAAARARQDRDAGAAVTSTYAKPGALRAAWPDLSTEQRREVLAAVIERVVIAPAPRPGQFDADRISVAWRA